MNLSKGNISIFQKLFSDYYVALCIYAARITQSNEIAEEVVQTVFVKLWEQRDKIIIQESFEKYLFASVRYQCLDHLKHLQVINRFNERYTQLLEDARDQFVFTQESGESLVIANELKKSILDAVDELPAQCRKIFMMSRFDGFKNKEIAHKLGVTTNTVQTQLSIALSKLRIKLSRYLPSLILLWNFKSNLF